MEEGSKALKLVREQLYINLATVLQEKDLMRLETIGKRSKLLKQGKEQFYNNLATVLQEIDLMRRETNGKRKQSFKAEERTIL